MSGRGKFELGRAASGLGKSRTGANGIYVDLETFLSTHVRLINSCMSPTQTGRALSALKRALCI